MIDVRPPATVVVVPSITFPVEELQKITAASHYEERMLFTLLFLRDAGLRVLYVTSLPIDPGIIDYYLGFLPDPDQARTRLELVALSDSDPRALTEKLLSRPEVLRQLRERCAAEPGSASLVTFNVTPAEARLSAELGIPLFGPRPDLVRLGTKSGARKVARRAGVAVLEGQEDLRSIEEVERALRALRAGPHRARAAVVKLNNGFSGQGNAIVELEGAVRGVATAPTTFCAPEESWASFAAKIEAEGAIVEAMLAQEGTVSPSVQVSVSGDGQVRVLSTHDQVLGGPRNHVYLGCRFPAQPRYRSAISQSAVRIAEVLAADGVTGAFGIDFLIAPESAGSDEPEVFMSEINLRLGGTTHPFWMTKLATGGSYEPTTGELLAGGRAKSYVATDNLQSPSLVGVDPAQVIRTIDEAGLAFERTGGTGAMLHLLGALARFGKMGTTCVADSLQDAAELYGQVVHTLTGDSPASLVK